MVDPIWDPAAEGSYLNIFFIYEKKLVIKDLIGLFDFGYFFMIIFRNIFQNRPLLEELILRLYTIIVLVCELSIYIVIYIEKIWNIIEFI